MKSHSKNLSSSILTVFTVLIIIMSLSNGNLIYVSASDQDNRFIPLLKYSPRYEAFNIEEEMTLTPIFTPDNAEDVYKAWIDRANDTIDIQNPYITMYDDGDWASDSHPVVRALVDAHGRGVTIRVQINENSDSDDITSYFVGLGIDVRYMGSSDANPDDEYLTTTHNKLVIIDNKVVITSSINFSENAFSNNREAGMVIQSSSVASHFTDFFVSDWEDGEDPAALYTSDFKAINKSSNKLVSLGNDYPSHTDIPATNFTGVYNVTVITNPDNADEVIFRYLESARASIYVSMYTISRPDFNNTLIDLKQANPALDIQVLISKRRVSPGENEDTRQAVESLVENLIPVYNSTTDDNSVDGYYHNKYWIIDGSHAFVYSGNWSPRSITPALTGGDTYYGSTEANRDMGVAVHDAPDIASFFKNVWDADVAAGTAWDMPVGIQQTRFTDGEIVNGEVVIAAQVTGLSSPEVGYRWGDADYTNVTLTGGSFSLPYDTRTLPNGIIDFDVRAINASMTFTDNVKVNIANYAPSENWRFLITETLPNPSTVPDDEGEFIEITNSFPFALYLEGWQVGDDGDLMTFPSDYQIDAYSSIIIARDSTGFTGAYPSVTADFELGISLVNTGDYIQLIDPKGNYIDVVAYGDASAPDGSVTNSAPGAGESLQRSPLHIDTDTSSDFTAGTPSPKGTVPFEPLNTETTGLTTSTSTISGTGTSETSEEASIPLLTVVVAMIVLPITRRKTRK